MNKENFRTSSAKFFIEKIARTTARSQKLIFNYPGDVSQYQTKRVGKRRSAKVTCRTRRAVLRNASLGTSSCKIIKEKLILNISINTVWCMLLSSAIFRYLPPLMDVHKIYCVKWARVHVQHIDSQ